MFERPRLDQPPSGRLIFAAFGFGERDVQADAT